MGDPAPGKSANTLILVSLFLLSFTIIGLQLALMRSLTYQKYYHFFYLVISIALLGFGASGTFLSFYYRRMKKRFHSSVTILLGMFAGSMIVCLTLAELIPLDVRYLLFSYSQLFLLILYMFLLFIPFFLGACIIGMFLTWYSGSVSRVYGVNLLGSGAGAIAALGVMEAVPPLRLPLHMTIYGLAALVLWLAGNSHLFRERPGRKIAVWVLLIAGSGCVVLFLPYRRTPDEYKALSHFQRLEKQGDAVSRGSEYSFRGVLDLYASTVFHHTLFSSPASESLPPDQMALIKDGELAGILFDAASVESTRIMLTTPQSLAYSLIPGARVLLLGDFGNTNIWLARLFGSDHITLVNGDPGITRIIRESLPDTKNITFVTDPPRLFIEANRGKTHFDVIHIAGSEGMPAIGSGLGSMYEDYLLTAESVSGMVELLAPGGIITVTRGVQTPPRDNIKIFRLFVAALRQLGLDPAERILQARNYLAVTTLLFREPVTSERVDLFLRECRKNIIDPEFFPGMEAGEIEYLNSLQGLEEGVGSSYYRAARIAVSGKMEEFGQEYLFDISVPSDDSPYFHHFFRWRASEYLRGTYGRFWFQRIELGYIILLIILAVLLCASFILILFPLLFTKKKNPGPGRIRGVFYFSCLGLAFMFLETSFIQRFILALSEPVVSTSAIITAVLCGAGAGSIFLGRVNVSRRRALIIACTGITVSAIMVIFFSGNLVRWLSHFSPALRYTGVLAIAVVPAFFMGWFFPSGISLYRDYNPSFVPLAWGVNGFSSVIASPLTVLLAVSAGFNLVLFFAIVLYVISLPVILSVGRNQGGP